VRATIPAMLLLVTGESDDGPENWSQTEQQWFYQRFVRAAMFPPAVGGAAMVLPAIGDRQ